MNQATSPPTSEHTCTRGAVTIAYPDGTGNVLTRRWRMCSCAAAALADALGPPDGEAIFTTGAAHEVGRLIAATPGVVIAPH